MRDGMRVATEPRVSGDDHRQALSLEQLEAAAAGRPSKLRAWVRADELRRGLGKRTAGRVSLARIDIAAAPMQLAERRATLIERAVRIAVGLPDGQRQPILAALRYLAPARAEDRVRAWLGANPGRHATRREIAAECGLARETVIRVITRLRRRTRGPRNAH